MDKRSELLEFISHRNTDKTIFSPLSDTLYAASVAGKGWVSEATVDDQIAAALACGYHPMFLHDTTVDKFTHAALSMTVKKVSDDGHERHYERSIVTPAGTLTHNAVERFGDGLTGLGDWINSVESFDIVEWISHDILAGNRDKAIVDHYSAFVNQVKPYGISEIQVELPFFMYGLVGFAEKPLLFYMEHGDRFCPLMELVEKALCRVIDLLLQAGIDCIWIGAPGTELMSPFIMEDQIIPQARRIVEYVHGRGGLVHFHCCGLSRLWVENHYYDQIGMDLVETLSAPPCGNVDDLALARSMISKNIVTKGNIDLGLIKNGTPADCAAAARAVIAATKGYPHIVGAADAILTGTPVENVRAIVDECERVN